MHRFSGPGWRLAGSTLSWLVFAFSFTSLYQVAAVVSGLGGFCASGGPYVIETECPEAVVLFAPLSILGLFIAIGLSLFLARGFGAPLIAWGWPILFIGLGIQFLLTGLQGSITGWVIAVLFIAMGAVPLVWQIRASPRRVVLGSHDVRDRRFVDRDGEQHTFVIPDRSDPGAAVEPTAGAWALSLGIVVVSAGLGVLLSLNALSAMAPGG